MSKIARFIIWICSKFTRKEIITIIEGLLDILQDRNPEVKPKDDFREKHPNYRDFYVDPLSPLTAPPNPKPPSPTLDYKQLLQDYEKQHGKQLSPVHRRGSVQVPAHTTCHYCSAPAEFLYINNGKHCSQVRCKVCNNLSQIEKRYRQSKTKYWCPHCNHALFLWKQKKLVTLYKCPNDNCPVYLKALEKLNPSEKEIRKTRSSQFKLRYQYREYHFSRHQLQPSEPDRPRIDLARAFNSDGIIGLVLTFYISFGLAARKTAQILRDVFNVPISYQTVLNYAEAAAHWCHKFNLAHKGQVDDSAVADEHYIKIAGKQAYTFLAISADNHKISAYHVADNRDTLPATITMLEAIRTAKPDQSLTIITDGNPAYPAGIHFINAHRDGKPIAHKKVIGLQNLDSESELFRRFKQLIERLSRTYKYHTRAACGFKCWNGAAALTVLFVTHYNFLRPHMSLDYRVPVQLEELASIPTIQAKWCRILDMAMNAA